MKIEDKRGSGVWEKEVPRTTWESDVPNASPWSPIIVLGHRHIYNLCCIKSSELVENLDYVDEISIDNL